jgi:peptidoglycan/LPS O-acetylase OafA/YrhL
MMGCGICLSFVSLRLIIVGLMIIEQVFENVMKSERSLGVSAFADSKPHYEILDGLRGVAALLVMWYHVHEGFSFASGAAVIDGINHGYLAVDFFFMLSGFVIAYAYDDRLGRSLSVPGFFKRRLIRLHPMVVLGAVWGVICFFMQGGTQWDGTHIATSAVMLALLCALFFIPAVPGSVMDVRGNGEAFSLNGPAWSLFFEYIGNILYALFIRRLKNRWLSTLVALLGIAWGAFAIIDCSGYGNIGVGWSLLDYGFFSGLLRMLFPFTLGMLLSRNFKSRIVRGAFWKCSVVLLLIFLVPNLTSEGVVSLNGVYEILVIAMVFPCVILLGASGTVKGAFSSRVCKFLGDISFPLYITHYPVMYMFYAWMIDTGRVSLQTTWFETLMVCVWNVAFAWLCFKFYDRPIRKWLAQKAN